MGRWLCDGWKADVMVCLGWWLCCDCCVFGCGCEIMWWVCCGICAIRCVNVVAFDGMGMFDRIVRG